VREEFPSITKTVSGASHRLDQLGWVVIVDLAAEAPDENFEDIGKRVVILVPDVRGNRGAIDDLTVMQDKELEEREFFRSQLDWFSTAPHTVPVEINLQVCNAHRLWQRRATTPSERAHPRQQLAKRERLGEIIVCTYLQSGYTIIDRVSRRQHENRCGDSPRSKLSTQVESAAAGKHDVKDEYIEAAERSLDLCVGIGSDRDDLDALLTEARLDDGRETGVVFNEKYFHERQSTSDRTLWVRRVSGLTV
jgi:hypothetical protein